MGRPRLFLISQCRTGHSRFRWCDGHLHMTGRGEQSLGNFLALQLVLHSTSINVPQSSANWHRSRRSCRCSNFGLIQCQRTSSWVDAGACGRTTPTGHCWGGKCKGNVPEWLLRAAYDPLFLLSRKLECPERGPTTAQPRRSRSKFAGAQTENICLCWHQVRRLKPSR